MNLNIQATNVFQRNYDALNSDKRFIINQGGSRSSKTYSLCQLIIIYCLTNPNKIVSVIRKTFPTLRGSVMRDFFEIMNDLNIYSEKNHNKTENIYKFDNGSIVEFFGADDSQKLRGRKRDILFANEANELSFDEFQQLNMRTTEKIILDFNPSDTYSYIYDLLIRDETILIHSTYKDNPFITDSQIKEIENLKNVDENYYKIYCLGERGLPKTTIFTHQKIFYQYPEKINDYIMSVDWGYNHPTCLMKVSYIENKYYCEELIYESYLTSSDFIQKLKILGVDKNKLIVADSARPELIEEVRRAGYNITGAIKDVKEGINSVKSVELFIHHESINTIKELQNYKYKTNGELILDEPVKIHDEAADCIRYAIHYLKKKTPGVVGVSFSFF
jgi:phage terminase large subunit